MSPLPLISTASPRASISIPSPSARFHASSPSAPSCKTRALRFRFRKHRARHRAVASLSEAARTQQHVDTRAVVFCFSAWRFAGCAAACQGTRAKRTPVTRARIRVTLGTALSQTREHKCSSVWRRNAPARVRFRGVLQGGTDQMPGGEGNVDERGGG
eukprot:2461576-Rhodomonas_salina.1